MTDITSASFAGLCYVSIQVTLEDKGPKRGFFGSSHSAQMFWVPFHYDPAPPPQAAVDGNVATEYEATDKINDRELLPEVAESLKVWDVVAAVAAMWGMDVLTDFSKPSLRAPRSQMPSFSAYAPVLDAFPLKIQTRSGWRPLEADEPAMSLAELARHLQPPPHAGKAPCFALSLSMTIPKTLLTYKAIARAAEAIASEAKHEERRAKNRRRARHVREREAGFTKTGRATPYRLNFSLLHDREAACCAITGLSSRLCQPVAFMSEYVGRQQLLQALRQHEDWDELMALPKPNLMPVPESTRARECVLNYCLGDAHVHRISNIFYTTPETDVLAGFHEYALTPDVTGWLLVPHLAQTFERFAWLVTPRGHALHLVDPDLRLDLSQELELSPAQERSIADPDRDYCANLLEQAGFGEAFEIPPLGPLAHEGVDVKDQSLPLIHLATLSSLFALFGNDLAEGAMRASMRLVGLSHEVFPGQAREEWAALDAVRFPEGRLELDWRRGGAASALGWFVAASGGGTDTDQEADDDEPDYDDGGKCAQEVRETDWSQAALDDLKAKELLVERRQRQRTAVAWIALMRRARVELVPN